MSNKLVVRVCLTHIWELQFLGRIGMLHNKLTECLTYAMATAIF